MNKNRLPAVRPCLIALTSAALALSGCKAGPDFVRPAPPDLTQYDQSAPASPAIAMGQNLPAQWWRLLQEPALPDVVKLALDSNQTLVAARATLAQAREGILQARANWYPTLSLSGSAGRSIVGNAPSQYYSSGANTVSNQFSLGPALSYTFDFAGQTARTVEQARANAENQHYQLAAAYLSLTSAVVTQAITIAMTQQLLNTSEELIKNDEKNLELVNKSFAAGTIAQTDVLTAQSQLENDRTQLPNLRQQLSVARHALTVLVSKAPAEWQPPAFAFDAFQLPATIPVSLPSSLVHQRPDILSAEAILHADSAAIGIAAAQLYPTVTLSISDTLQSSLINTLFSSSNNVLNATTGASWTLFQGGALESQQRAAVDAYNAQLANYKQTVIVAFGQVADALRALDNDNEALALAQKAHSISATALRLQRASYSAGKSNVLQLISAENAFAQANMNLVRVRGQRLLDCVTLFAALGGAWDADEAIGPPQLDASANKKTP